MVQFSAIVTKDNLIVSAPDGQTHTMESSHKNYEKAKQYLRDIQSLRKNGEDAADEIEKLILLMVPANKITKHGIGLVTVENGVVMYAGKVVDNSIVASILWALDEGFEINSYLHFLNNLMENTSNRAVVGLYDFISNHKMGISEDGHILGYKMVRSDFTDCHTGTMDNSPGQIVSMPRNEISDDPDLLCSHGLHLCSQSYLKWYGSRGNNGDPTNKIIIVKCNPRDVVCIPKDHGAAKIRACRYEVIGEYTGTDDLLKSKPVFFNTWNNDDEDHDDEGVVLTTDADGVVDPDWLHFNFMALEAGADAVAGWVEEGGHEDEIRDGDVEVSFVPNVTTFAAMQESREIMKSREQKAENSPEIDTTTPASTSKFKVKDTVYFEFNGAQCVVTAVDEEKKTLTVIEKSFGGQWHVANMEYFSHTNSFE